MSFNRPLIENKDVKLQDKPLTSTHSSFFEINSSPELLLKNLKDKQKNLTDNANELKTIINNYQLSRDVSYVEQYIRQPFSDTCSQRCATKCNYFCSENGSAKKALGIGAYCSVIGCGIGWCGYGGYDIAANVCGLAINPYSMSQWCLSGLIMGSITCVSCYCLSTVTCFYCCPDGTYTIPAAVNKYYQSETEKQNYLNELNKTNEQLTVINDKIADLEKKKPALPNITRDEKAINAFSLMN